MSVTPSRSGTPFKGYRAGISLEGRKELRSSLDMDTWRALNEYARVNRISVGRAASHIISLALRVDPNVVKPAASAKPPDNIALVTASLAHLKPWALPPEGRRRSVVAHDETSEDS